MKLMLIFFLLPLYSLFACATDSDTETREILSKQAERYEDIILERETDRMQSVVRGMTKLLFVEAERDRSEADRTSLALKLEDRIDRFGDGVRAVSLELKYYEDAEFAPFIAAWSDESGFRRTVQGDARIPDTLRATLSLHEQEMTFTDGAQDERRVRIRLYYSIAGLEQRLRGIRSAAGIDKTPEDESDDGQ